MQKVVYSQGDHTLPISSPIILNRSTGQLDYSNRMPCVSYIRNSLPRVDRGTQEDRGLSKLPQKAIAIYNADQLNPKAVLTNILMDLVEPEQIKALTTYTLIETRNRIYFLLRNNLHIDFELEQRVHTLLRALNVEFAYRELVGRKTPGVISVFLSVLPKSESIKDIMDFQLSDRRSDLQMSLFPDPDFFEITDLSRKTIYQLMPFLSTFINQHSELLDEFPISVLKMIHSAFVLSEKSGYRCLDRHKSHMCRAEEIIYKRICILRQKEKSELSRSNYEKLVVAFHLHALSSKDIGKEGLLDFKLTKAKVQFLECYPYYDQFDRNLYEVNLINLLNAISASPFICLGELITKFCSVRAILDGFFKQRKAGATENVIAVNVVNMISKTNLLSNVSWKCVLATFIDDAVLKMQLSPEHKDELERDVEAVIAKGDNFGTENRSIYHYTLLLRVLKKAAFILGGLAHMWDVHSPGYVDEIRLSELIILRKTFEIEAAYFQRHELSILSKKCHNMANFLNLVIALRRLNGLLKGSLEKPNRVNHAIFTQALNIFSTMICIRSEVNDSLVANTSANDVFLHHSDLDVFSLKRFFAEDYEKIGLKQIDVMPHLNQFLDYLLLLYALRPLEVARSLFQQTSSKTLQALSLVIKDYAGKCKRVRGVVLDEIRGVLEERQVRERKESVKGRRKKHSTSI